MLRLLKVACRAFPSDHRARRSAEVVDTALLAADGSKGRATREALSLVVLGVRERVRRESGRPPRDGLWLLAAVLAVVNLAVAIVRATAWGGFTPIAGHPGWVRSVDLPFSDRPDWWRIAVVVAAAGIVFGLIVGDRRLVVGAALSNCGLVVWDCFAPSSYFQTIATRGFMSIDFRHSFPGGGLWLLPAIVLAAAAAAAPLHRPPLMRLPGVAAVVAAAVVFAHEMRPWDGYGVVVWPLAVLVLLTIAFGANVRRLAVLTGGLVLAVAPYLFALPAGVHSHRLFWGSIATALLLGSCVPFARLARRRLA